MATVIPTIPQRLRSSSSGMVHLLPFLDSEKGLPIQRAAPCAVTATAAFFLVVPRDFPYD
jgi:hypothetical protein